MSQQLSKGEKTKRHVLLEAMRFASTYSLSKVTIGEVAKRSGLSRTGVISHFKNKEDMQVAILKFSEQEFVNKVVKPSYTDKPFETLKNLFVFWMGWNKELNFGDRASCPFVKAAAEFQDQETSKVRETIKDQQKRLLHLFSKTAQLCVESGDFKRNADIDAFAYEAYSLYLGHNIAKNLLESKKADERFLASVESLLSRYVTKSEKNLSLIP